MKAAKIRKNTGYFFMAVFAIFISLYPLKFIWAPVNEGLLGSKSSELISSFFYLPAFYTHIFPGGLALLMGFSQFFPKLRRKRPGLHRVLGKIYVISVLLSGTAGLAIAYFATGGFITALGFALLAILWLYTTVNAYTSIRKMDISNHQKWMIRSYALCFAAVTLRIYLPVFTGLLGMSFIPAYTIIAWLCWMPNLAVAEWLIIRPMSLQEKSVNSG
ncbi:MAG: DUF2306 domain-containing protein [Flavobacteriaceae bacterium]